MQNTRTPKQYTALGCIMKLYRSDIFIVPSVLTFLFWLMHVWDPFPWLWQSHIGTHVGFLLHKTPQLIFTFASPCAHVGEAPGTPLKPQMCIMHFWKGVWERWLSVIQKSDKAQRKVFDHPPHNHKILLSKSEKPAKLKPKKNKWKQRGILKIHQTRKTKLHMFNQVSQLLNFA